MAGFSIKYNKSKATVLDHINVHCDKRSECDRGCPALTTDGLKQTRKEDVAYTEPRHCTRFRPTGGNVEGADIREIGLWK